MKSLNYDVLKQEIINVMENSKSIVLATCSNNRVTAREVYFASKNFSIYFLTSKAYDKYKQIEKNKNVALCLGNIQMEGIAIIKGHPSLSENKIETNICLNKSRKELEHFIKYKNTILIEVLVTRVGIWKNNGREYLDVKKGESYRVG